MAPNPRSKADVIKNVYGWNAKADLLYVDQPVGTGFSYTSDQSEYVKTEARPQRSSETHRRRVPRTAGGLGGRPGGPATCCAPCGPSRPPA